MTTPLLEVPQLEEFDFGCTFENVYRHHNFALVAATVEETVRTIATPLLGRIGKYESALVLLNDYGTLGSNSYDKLVAAIPAPASEIEVLYDAKSLPAPVSLSKTVVPDDKDLPLQTLQTRHLVVVSGVSPNEFRESLFLSLAAANGRHYYTTFVFLLQDGIIKQYGHQLLDTVDCWVLGQSTFREGVTRRSPKEQTKYFVEHVVQDSLGDPRKREALFHKMCLDQLTSTRHFVVFETHRGENRVHTMTVPPEEVASASTAAANEAGNDGIEIPGTPISVRISANTPAAYGGIQIEPPASVRISANTPTAFSGNGAIEFPEPPACIRISTSSSAL